jgi:hypothetical protein
MALQRRNGKSAGQLRSSLFAATLRRAGSDPKVGEWSTMRAKFQCPVGVTNVWRGPQVNGAERIQGSRNGMKYRFSSLHGSQKPLRFIELFGDQQRIMTRIKR